MQGSPQRDDQPAVPGPRVVVAAGGTAGHVMPALAVADELRARGAETSFIGASGKMEEELVPAAGHEIDSISVSGIDRRNPFRAVYAAGKAAAAVHVCRRILKRVDAGVVLGGGGYVVGPAGLAATQLGIPLVLTEADRRLGLANRMLARKAARTCLAYPLPDRTGPEYVVTGRPVPQRILRADREKARARFGITRGAKALLITGGSQGARSINQAAAEAFGSDLDRGFHVIHLAGKRDYSWIRDRLVETAPRDYTLLEYEPDLGDCLAASDLVVTRSGGSIFEVMARGLPAILVPYPYASADHQTANGEWMAEAGAGVVVPDAELDSQRLVTEVKSVLTQPLKLEAMAASSRSLARPDAASAIADQVFEASRSTLSRGSG